MFTPNFQGECRICGTSPTVVVPEHECPETNLCGPHFFNETEMFDWDLWIDKPPVEESNDDE